MMEWKLLILVVGCLYAGSQTPVVEGQIFAEVVSKCSRRSNLVTVPLDADCRTFASCSGIVFGRPAVQYCSPGTLFDSMRQICNHAKNVDCTASGSQDPCSGQPDGLMEDRMRSKENRAAVLQCEGGRTVGGYRCSVCNAFGSSDTGCVPISNCQMAETTPPNICNHEAVPDNPNQYVAIGLKSRDIVTCGNGTVYKPDLCGCGYE